MSNLKYDVAIIYYQDDAPIIVKIGDYIEIELINGEIIKGEICEIDTESYVIFLINGNNNWFDINIVKRIIAINNQTF